VIGECNVGRVGVEILAFAFGVALAALIAMPLVKVMTRR